MTLVPLFQSLHDSLMVLAPRGWTTLTARFAPGADGPRLSELEARGDGTTAPKAKPELHVDPKAEARRLAEAVGELVESLNGRWAPGSMTVHRTADATDFKLLRDDGTQAYFTRLERQHLDMLLMTDPLFELIAASEKGFHDLQLRLEQRLRRTVGFSFDPASARLVLRQADGPPLECTVQVVGQYFAEDFTWAWSWAFENEHPANAERVKQICAPDVAQPGLSALWRPQLQCDEGLVWAIAGSLVLSLGARGLFRGELPDGAGVVFFAVLTDPA